MFRQSAIAEIAVTQGITPRDQGPYQALTDGRSVSSVELEVVKQAVRLACRAPSVHNTQPWRWLVEDDVIHLYLDRHRVVPATDPSGRQAIISCGAVLDHFRVAMAASGWQANIVRFPYPKNPDHLAAIDFRPFRRVTVAEQNRAEAILQRRTDRLAFDCPTYWEAFESALRGTVDEGIAMLDVLDDDHRPRLVEASELSEELRRDDWTYHDELAWWTSPFTLSDGIPPSALASPSDRLRVDLARDFPSRNYRDHRPQVSADWAKILVLSTPADTPLDALRCGEMLSSVLLECTLAGMATCTLTHLVEANESRDIVRDLIDHRGEPQVLVRVGIAPPFDNPSPPTPRRALSEVLQLEKGLVP